MGDRLRIVLIDDHPLMLQGLRSLLDDPVEFHVVGTGRDLHDAVALAQNHRPDIMLIEINITGNGFEAAKFMHRNYPSTKIVIFTSSVRLDHVKFAMDHGIAGYVVKNAAADELIQCLRTVKSGKRFVSPSIAARMVTGEADEKTSARVANFTSRERVVLNGLAQGHTNKEIAEVMKLSDKTVKHHMSVVMEKLGVRNRVEAALAIAKLLEDEAMQNGPLQ